MHLRIVYQHLSTSSYPLWLRGSPGGVNCLALPDSTRLSATRASHKQPLLEIQRCPGAESSASTFTWVEELASVMAGTKGGPSKISIS